MDIISKIQQQKITEATVYIRSQVKVIPKIAIVLGSGLGYFGDKINADIKFQTKEIPHYPQPTVTGHQGRLIFGKIDEIPVIAVKGRSHYYEGKPLEEVTFYIQVFKQLGVKKLILTNAAGGVNPDFMPGNFVLIEDFINFGQVKVMEAMENTRLLDANLQNKALNAAKELNINLKKGIYCWTTGPSFETPAEVKAIRSIGGDLAGMSTLPEAIVAKHFGMKILGISLVTNQAAGITDNPLTHDEVKETASQIKEPYYYFMKNVILNIA